MHFLTLQLLKAVRSRQVFYAFNLDMSHHVLPATGALIWLDGSAPAALARLLVDPPEPPIIGKNKVFRDLLTFSRTCLFFSYFIFFDLFSPPLLFSDFLL